MISIRRVSLGGGYRYLLRSVAAGDGAGGTNPLARYYASSGTPPGVFMGAGLAHSDGGRGVTPGTQVTEEHMEHVRGLCRPAERQARGAAPGRPGRVPVAGFDLTCSPAKSVSVAWALADEATKAVIYGCHRRAVEAVLAYAEDEVFRSRSGTNGIVEEDVDGVVAVSFSHWASRADDPQLHDHVLTWARARCTSDGRWRTLDSRALYKAVTTLSELYDGVLADLLTAALGFGWEERERRHSTRARFEVAGVPEALMAEFSRRAGQVAAHAAELRAQFVAAHGRQPTAVEDMRLHQVATIATRPAKSHASLSELTEEWRERADRHVPRALQAAWVASLAGRNDLPLLRAGDLAEAILADAARAVLAAVSERHATFSRMNVLAEAHRVLHGARFQGPADRIEVAERVSRLALGSSLPVAGPEVCYTPATYPSPRRLFAPAPESRALYTTQALLRRGPAPGSRPVPGRPGGEGGYGGPHLPRPAAGAGIRAEHRPGPGGGEGGHFRESARRIGGPVGHGQVDHHGRPAGRLGGRARPRLGARAGPDGGGGRGAGRRARDGHREHGEVAHRTKTGPRAHRPPGPAGGPGGQPGHFLARPKQGGRRVGCPGPGHRGPPPAAWPPGHCGRGQPGRHLRPRRAGERRPSCRGQGAPGGRLGAAVGRGGGRGVPAPGGRPGRYGP